MKKEIKIGHLADIHIPNLKNLENVKPILNKTVEHFRNNRVDIIEIVGDLFNDYISISNEAKIVAAEFLRELSTLCKVIVIVDGNHDIRKKDLTRKTSVEVVVKNLKLNNLYYFNESRTYTIKEFDNLVYVNYSHLQKDVKPLFEKEIGKIYIGLFHDPVFGCKTNTKTFNDNKLIKLDYFYGCDFVHMGDIHLRQFFNDNRIAYPSSLYQNNHGECLYEHGVLIWNIRSVDDFDAQAFNIENEHAYITLNLDSTKGEIDYNNIISNSMLYSSDVKNFKTVEIKVKRTDFISNIDNKIFKHNIEKAVYQLYDNIVGFDFDTPVKLKKEFKDINSEADIDVNINDHSNFIKIITTYLKENNYNSADIAEILNIEDIIENRLPQIRFDVNSDVELISVGCNNFKSFGDDVAFVFDGIRGIIQISGKNRAGKSSLFDLISYAMYGTTYLTNTLSGAKVLKFKDKQYVNNKRNLDSCDSFVCLKINSQFYTVIRKTEIERKKNGEIKNVSTSVQYNEGFDCKFSSENQGERNKDTQKIIEEKLGDFKEFIRSNYITADNLNDLLTMDKSDFIDGVAKDMGYGRIDEKYKEVGDYEKEEKAKKTTIIIKPIEEDEKIKKIEADVVEIENRIDLDEKSILDLNTSIQVLSNDKSELQKSLIPIEQNLLKTNIDKINESVINITRDVKNIEDEILVLEKNVEDDKNLIANKGSKLNEKLLSDSEILNTTLTSKISLKNSLINDLNKKSADEKIKLESNRNKKSNLKTEFINKCNLVVAEKTNAISLLEVDFKNDVKNLLKNWEDKIVKCESDKVVLNTRIENTTNNYKNLKKDKEIVEKEIVDLLNLNNCPFCGSIYSNENELHQKHILENKNKADAKKLETAKIDEKIKIIIEDGTKLRKKIEDLDKRIIRLNSKIKEYESEDEYKTILNKKDLEVGGINSEIENIKYYINNPDSSKKLLEKYVEVDKNILDCEDAVKKLEEEITKETKEILEAENEISKLKIVITQQKEIKSLHDVLNKHKLELANKINDKNLDENKLNATNKQIEDYNKVVKDVASNKVIEDKIKVIECDLEIKNNEKEELIKIVSAKTVEIKNLNNQITEIKQLIIDYTKQVHKYRIIDAYKKLVHRDGLPTYLLKKSKDLINSEMSDILVNADFEAFLDDELKLKMYEKSYNGDDKDQIALTASGAERTFISLAFKTALRNVNYKNKFNFIILDEITGKLVDEYVEKFSSLLQSIKEKIDIIFIVEHNHEINEDYLIQMKKNKKFITEYETNF